MLSVFALGCLSSRGGSSAQIWNSATPLPAGVVYGLIASGGVHAPSVYMCLVLAVR